MICNLDDPSPTALQPIGKEAKRNHDGDVVGSDGRWREIYSPPRAVAMASRMGFRRGWGLDFATHDKGGREWDFISVEMRNRSAREALRDKQSILIGSPMRGPFSIMNNIHYSRVDASQVNSRIEHGRRHFNLCTTFCRTQADNSRYFVHGHFETVSSWQGSCIKRMFHEHGVERVIGDECTCGFNSNDGVRDGPVRKNVGFFTDSPLRGNTVIKAMPKLKRIWYPRPCSIDRWESKKGTIVFR